MRRLRRLRVRTFAVLTLGVALAPLAVRASAPGAGDADAVWVGRYCTPLGCRGEADSGLGDAAGFAVAAAAVAHLARRRRA